MIGLKIMLEHGHYLGLVMEAGEAIRVCNLWSGPNPPPKFGSHNVKCPPGSPTWSVENSKIIGMHTFGLEELQGQMPAQGFKPWAGRSGL